ncbi:hypothetical protein [Alteraurantiacibacter aquimixticola]|uniref:Uncharacterized protein n=1 Tax=Alteraurantiacibacter aquimixticola TaxID=2489173 RepID=A0A4T3EX05_9SPHN|nr:hypothetical protein [Alteraurantiacibacter aquimixticola]TIX49115.1 hypothetical protein E5222_15440 [Alteraurantiacibacter aquimixticola]
MANTKTSSLSISEMREFAGFSADEQAFITRSLDVFMGRGDAFKSWASSEGGDYSSIRAQYLAYRELRVLRSKVPDVAAMDGVADFIGTLTRISAQDLAHEMIESFSAYRFLYERLLGAEARPYLPAAFVAAAALPQIRPDTRKTLLQSLSEAAATAPGWSMREAAFYPERIEDENEDETA